MKIDNFLKGSGALFIGLGIALACSFPGIAVGTIIGWYFIQESLQEKK
jgi:F0F1-type ATP synthase membrane subunit c/vacuolar-type H+-ATPase subunit K